MTSSFLLLPRLLFFCFFSHPPPQTLFGPPPPFINFGAQGILLSLLFLLLKRSNRKKKKKKKIQNYFGSFGACSCMLVFRKIICIIYLIIKIILYGWFCFCNLSVVRPVDRPSVTLAHIHGPECSLVFEGKTVLLSLAF